MACLCPLWPDLVLTVPYSGPQFVLTLSSLKLTLDHFVVGLCLIQPDSPSLGPDYFVTGA